jgi:2-(1,2-epoxy-1,2-dihydrophenyl)acetyl-CoA isomerase
VRFATREDGGVNELQPTVNDDVIVERTGPQGSLAIVTINRPEAMGALSLGAKEELLAGLTDVGADPSVRAVLLASRGRAFCVGQDLRELQAAYASSETPDLGDLVRRYYNPIVRAVSEMPKPVVAAINGAVAGAGLGIALACDLRWAARSAVFATAFAGIGLAGDSGITWSLSRLVGTAKTAALMYLNERVSAEGALELGLVNAVVDDDLLADSARELALRLAAGPTAAFAAIKHTLFAAATQSLPESLVLEADLQERIGRTADHLGGVASFFAKEQPTFTGH